MSAQADGEGGATSAILTEQRVRDLPRGALAEHGIGGDIAYDLLANEPLANELLLDACASLNLATFVTT